MPLGLSRTDQRLLWGTAIAGLVLVVAALAIAPPDEQQGPGSPTSYSSASGGAKAAYLLLERLHHPVQRWNEPPTKLGALGDERVTLVIADARTIPPKPEQQALLRFVREGGTLLFCGPLITQFFPEAKLTDDPVLQTNFTPDMPSNYTRGANRIEMSAVSSWRNLKPEQVALYGGEHPVVVDWRVGKGEIVWWAGATPLTNAGLKEQDDLVLFLNVFSNAPDSILWDEYFREGEGTLWTYMARTPVKWAVLQCGLVLGFVLLGYSRRWGLILPAFEEPRTSPLEFVDTLGSIYSHAKAISVPVMVNQRHLRMELTRALALPADAPVEILCAAAAQRLGWQEDHLRSALSATPGTGTLDMVQQLARFSAMLSAKHSAHLERK